MMNSKYKNGKQIPSSNADVTIIVPATRNSSSATREGELTVEDYRTALRLLVGAALEGTDELRLRLQPWWEDVQAWERHNTAPVTVLEGRDRNTLLYSLLGVLFKTPEYLSRGTSAAGRISSRATSILSRLTRPITRSRVMRPVQRNYEYLVARGESVVNSLSATGRSEARTSRLLVRQNVSDDTLEDILTYLVEKAKIRELIAEQGVEAAGDASTEIRTRSAAVDSSLDNLVDNLLRRQKLQKPPTGSSN
jgi:hypothetical protein